MGSSAALPPLWLTFIGGLTEATVLFLVLGDAQANYIFAVTTAAFLMAEAAVLLRPYPEEFAVNALRVSAMTFILAFLAFAGTVAAAGDETRPEPALDPNLKWWLCIVSFIVVITGKSLLKEVPNEP